MPEKRLASFWCFSITAGSLPLDYWPLSSRSTPHAALRWNQRGQVRPGADHPPLATLPPTAGLPKSERGPISTSTSSISVCHQTRRFLRTNQIVLPRVLADLHRVAQAMTCDHGRETVVRTGEAPSLGRKADRIALTGEVRGFPRLNRRPWQSRLRRHAGWEKSPILTGQAGHGTCTGLGKRSRR
jgi:hypothetical protein